MLLHLLCIGTACGFATDRQAQHLPQHQRHAPPPVAEMKLKMFSSDTASKLGARCMDGSPGGYYVLKASAENTTKWVIYIEGGGECRSQRTCGSWSQQRGSSSTWASTMPTRGGSMGDSGAMDSDCAKNPEWCDWNKVYIPYCSGDMHSGTRKEVNSWGYYFAGHLLIEAVIDDIKGSTDYQEATEVLVKGDSAGGIAALTHVDYFASHFTNARVKANPGCGFFYAGVSSEPDFESGVETPVSKLGFTSEWAPWIDQSCKEATGGNVSACTDAHFLMQYLENPVFIMENMYDAAKLANCGLEYRGRGSEPISAEDERYMKQWGKYSRAQWDKIAAMDGKVQHGFFSASCFDHGGTFGFATSPEINGVTMRQALINWYFDLSKDKSLLYNYDDCGDLPCTKTTGAQYCTHVTTNTRPRNNHPYTHGNHPIPQHDYPLRDFMAHRMEQWHNPVAVTGSPHGVCDI